MRKKITKYCKYCGKELSERHKIFCDNKCQSDYEYQTYISEWKEGKQDGNKGKCSISNHIRRYLIEKHDSKCQLCGWGEVNPWTGKVPLEVHHIDGNYLNNREENLQILCPNCHSLTENYKNLNYTRGRKSRRK